ncbi:MAG: hypothetical protein J0L86_12520 [Flavobacteriales bacterium]|nr:hypothetical protein [Flavobacteriales bacterium]
MNEWNKIIVLSHSIISLEKWNLIDGNNYFTQIIFILVTNSIKKLLINQNQYYEI